ncbi:MAG: COG4223 family protein [Alphaproteobacteria bacterium]
MAANDQEKPTGGRPRRKPSVTIDLPAEQVSEAPSGNEDDQAAPIPVSLAAGDQEPPRPNRPRNSDGDFVQNPVGAGSTPRQISSGWSLLAGAVMGALAVLMGGYLLLFTEILPAPGGAAGEDALAQTEQLAADIEVIQETLAANPAPDLTPFSDRLAALENAIAGLEELQIAINDIQTGLEAADQERAAIAVDLIGVQREAVAAAAAAGDPQAAAQLGESIATLGDRLTALERAGPGVEVGALEVLTEQLQAELATLAATTAVLAANAEERDQTADAARVLAINNLRLAADRGGPFVAELSVLAEFGIGQDALDNITPMAETGVDNEAELTLAFDELAFDILDATNQAGPDAGFWERLLGNARGVVTVRPTTAIEGDSAAAIVSRVQASLDAGDFSAALAERESLPETGLEASADWAARVEMRLTLDTAITDLANTIQQQIAE